MSLQLFINNVTRGFDPESLSITENATQRNTASFSLKSPTGDLSIAPMVGHPIRIEKIVGSSNYILFAGTVDSIDESNEPGTPAIAWSLQCVDYNQVADRILVTSSYEGKSVQEIVVDIVSGYLAGDGITAGSIAIGPTLEKITFPQIYVRDALNDLSNISGGYWFIDYQKKLHFVIPPETLPIAVASLRHNQPYRNLSVKRSRSQYRNSQTVIAGHDISVPQTESFKGDGTNKIFPVSLPIAEVPTVMVNGTPRSVGIKRVDIGFDFYWSKNDGVVEHEKSAAALTDTDTIDITYRGYYPVTIRQMDRNAVSQRAAIEGGSGIYENIEKDESLDSRRFGIEKALGLVRRFSRIPNVISFEVTDKLALAYNLYAVHAGQRIFPVDIPQHGISNVSGGDNYFIQRVGIRTQGYTGSPDGSGGIITYQIEAINVDFQSTWEAYWAQLTRGTRKYSLRDDQELTAFRDIAGDQVELSDSVSRTTSSPVSEFDVAELGFSEFA